MTAESTEPIAADLKVDGPELSPEETAAVVTVLGRLAATELARTDAGGTGPLNRALQRKHRLDYDQHGLWGRPGASSWNRASGGRL